jgi:hypothetical protein
MNAVVGRFHEGSLDSSFVDASNREMSRDYRHYIQSLSHAFTYIDELKRTGSTAHHDTMELLLMFLYSEIQQHFWVLYEFQIRAIGSQATKEDLRESDFFPKQIDSELYRRSKERFPESPYWKRIDPARSDTSALHSEEAAKTAEIKGFVFKTSLEIPAGSEKMLIQAGKKVPFSSKLDKAKPYCAVFSGHTDGEKIRAGQAYAVAAVFNLDGRQVAFELSPIGDSYAPTLTLQCSVAYDAGAKGLPTLEQLQSAIQGYLQFYREL